MANVIASTKRAPAISGGKRGKAITNIPSLLCTPLDPVDENAQRRYSTNAAFEIKQTFCELGLDIREGDLLVVGSKEYPVRAVGNWNWRGTDYLQLFIEEQKTWQQA